MQKSFWHFLRSHFTVGCIQMHPKMLQMPSVAVVVVVVAFSLLFFPFGFCFCFCFVEISGYQWIQLMSMLDALNWLASHIGTETGVREIERERGREYYVILTKSQHCICLMSAEIFSVMPEYSYSIYINMYICTIGPLHALYMFALKYGFVPIIVGYLPCGSQSSKHHHIHTHEHICMCTVVAWIYYNWFGDRYDIKE